MRRRPRSRPTAGPPDPIADYREWTEHSHDITYWASQGKTPPTVKNLWSTRDRKWLGAIYVSAPLIGVIDGWLRGLAFDEWLLFALGSGVYLALGLIMLLARDGRRKRRS